MSHNIKAPLSGAVTISMSIKCFTVVTSIDFIQFSQTASSDNENMWSMIWCAIQHDGDIIPTCKQTIPIKKPRIDVSRSLRNWATLQIQVEPQLKLRMEIIVWHSLMDMQVTVCFITRFRVGKMVWSSNGESSTWTCNVVQFYERDRSIRRFSIGMTRAPANWKKSSIAAIPYN